MHLRADQPGWRQAGPEYLNTTPLNYIKSDMRRAAFSHEDKTKAFQLFIIKT